MSSDPCFGASLAAWLTPSRPPISRRTEAASADWVKSLKLEDVRCRFWACDGQDPEGLERELWPTGALFSLLFVRSFDRVPGSQISSAALKAACCNPGDRNRSGPSNLRGRDIELLIIAFGRQWKT